MATDSAGCRLQTESLIDGALGRLVGHSSIDGLPVIPAQLWKDSKEATAFDLLTTQPVGEVSTEPRQKLHSVVA